MSTFNSIEEYTKALNKRIKLLQTSEKQFALVVNGTHAEIVDRIFGEGKNEKNSQIGKYSTKPTLAGAKSFTTKSGFNKIAGSKTKRKKLEWVTIRSGGKQVNLFEVPGGYKQIRSLDGSQTSFVDLTRSGELKSDFAKAAQRLGPFKYATGVRKDINSKKIEGNEKRFGGIFQPTKKERGFHSEQVSKLLAKIWSVD